MENRHKERVSKMARLISVLSLSAVIAIYSASSFAQDSSSGCETLIKCAEKAVGIASRLDEANQVLSKRITALEEELNKYKETNDELTKALGDAVKAADLRVSGLGRGRILAIVKVKEKSLVYKSDGLSFDSNTGVVSFPNPNHLVFVPVVSDSREG
jgi:hypothetical protein